MNRPVLNGLHILTIITIVYSLTCYTIFYNISYSTTIHLCLISLICDFILSLFTYLRIPNNIILSIICILTTILLVFIPYFLIKLIYLSDLGLYFQLIGIYISYLWINWIITLIVLIKNEFMKKFN
jgi:hypothetical protein